MRHILREEAVIHPEDLLLRRLDSTAVVADRARASEILRRALAPPTPDPAESDGSGSPSAS
jgi:hypothetical protein